MTGGDNGAEESADFREAMRELGVKQLRGHDRHRPEPPAPPVLNRARAERLAPRPGRPRADRGVLLDTTDGGDGESVAFARGGVQKTVLRKLKRRGVTELRVIHGKGLRSGPFGGVLRGVTCEFLKRHAAVLAFCSAQPKDGGSGAMYVLLKSGRRR